MSVLPSLPNNNQGPFFFTSTLAGRMNCVYSIVSETSLLLSDRPCRHRWLCSTTINLLGPRWPVHLHQPLTGMTSIKMEQPPSHSFEGNVPASVQVGANVLLRWIGENRGSRIHANISISQLLHGQCTWGLGGGVVSLCRRVGLEKGSVIE